MSQWIYRIAAFSGFSFVVLGAIGAHAFKEVLEAHGSVGRWQTAVFYQAIHTIVLLWMSDKRPFPKWASIAFVAGIVMFSGGLYLYSLSGLEWARSITPVGGICFLLGWSLLGFRKFFDNSTDREK